MQGQLIPLKIIITSILVGWESRLRMGVRVNRLDLDLKIGDELALNKPQAS